MRTRLLLAAAMLAAASTATKAQSVAYTITGTAPEGTRMMYVYAEGDDKVDSTAAGGGRFAFSGTRPLNALLVLTDGRRDWPLFNDGTPADLDLVNMAATASPLNERLFAASLSIDSINERGMALYGEYERAAADNSEAGRRRQAELSRQFAALGDSMTSTHLRIIRENSDNLIPAALIGPMAKTIDYETLRSLLDPAAPYYDHPALKRAKSVLEETERALGNRRPGLKYSDIELPDTTGTPRRVSEWCGKGGYVLIDFWASWCGPCRMEMPNVVSNYNKYRHDGFEVVGISLDSDARAWKKAIGDMQMEWPQLSDLRGWQSAAAGLYSVRAIPSSILIDGSGTIVATDLRGERLGEKLKAIYGH